MRRRLLIENDEARKIEAAKVKVEALISDNTPTFNLSNIDGISEDDEEYLENNEQEETECSENELGDED